MTKKTVLSADIGTTSLKAALIDFSGSVKAFAKESFEKPDEKYIARKWFPALCSAAKKLIDEARAQHVRVVFVQREFDRKHAESVAREIGARVVVIDPLSAQWKDEMLKIGQALTK